MGQFLEQLQARLHRHFLDLAIPRKEANHPIFALEHGLSHDETLALESELRRRFLVDGLSDSHWLVWVVYAAEQGYNYDGSEYWHSFESRTKLWHENGDRDRIRRWFVRFSKAYFGVSPSGRWASHFSIISWPITHAILPLDLQRQLARALYNARYRLADSDSLSPGEAGRLVAGASHMPSSRFRLFLEQENLVGQIVLALLEHGSGSAPPIDAMTLDRIIGDLNAVQEAKAWLNDAKYQYSTPRFRVGPPITPGGKRHMMEAGGIEAQSPMHTGKVLLRPAVTAQRSRTGPWVIVISLPSFQPLADINEEYAAFLKKTRVALPYADDRPLPAGWLLTGLRQRTVAEWPTDGTCLVRFDAPSVPFSEILNADCKLPSGPVWTFKLGASGVGQMLYGHNLTPGHKYLLVSRHEILLAGFAEECHVQCQSLRGIIVKLPEQVPEDLRLVLKGLGLETSRSITIAPVGLMPRQWDGQGLGEWLTTEQPCFELVRDHDFDSFRLQLDEADEVNIPCGLPGERIFFHLGPLEAGTHTLTVTTAQTAAPLRSWHAADVAHGSITLLVREPNTWDPENYRPAGVLIDASPPEPTIDDLLDGHLGLDVVGDTTRVARCAAVLIAPSGNVLRRDEIIEHHLPITWEAWARALKQFLSKDIDEISFLRADRGYISVDCDDLGEFRIPLIGHYGPLRWLVRTPPQDVLRLVNDGPDTGLITCFYSFSTPTKPSVIDRAHSLGDIHIGAPGGLFVAQIGEIVSAIIVAPTKIHGGLDALQVTFDRSSLAECRTMSCLVKHIAMWRTGAVSGPIAASRRRSVLKELEQQLLGLLCGPDWVRSEDFIARAPHIEKNWERIEAKVGKPISFAITLVKAWRENGEAGESALGQRFVSICKKYGICDNDNLIRGAWDAALAPSMFSSMSDDEGKRMFDALERNRPLVRGARLLAICRTMRPNNIR